MLRPGLSATALSPLACLIYGPQPTVMNDQVNLSMFHFDYSQIASSQSLPPPHLNGKPRRKKLFSSSINHPRLENCGGENESRGGRRSGTTWAIRNKFVVKCLEFRKNCSRYIDSLSEEVLELLHNRDSVSENSETARQVERKKKLSHHSNAKHKSSAN